MNADTFVNGNYILNGGTITGRMSVPSMDYHRVDASVLQTGGTNLAVSMSLGDPNRYGGMAFYTLSNGVVRVASSTTFSGGKFSQFNGVHTIASNFVMHGTDIGMGFATADYFLGGGTFSAGGLTAENIAEAILTVRPYAVDVASGVESSPGKKDPAKLRAFFAEVRKGDDHAVNPVPILLK